MPLCWTFLYHSPIVLSVDGSVWCLVRNLRCAVIIDTFLANSNTEHFLITCPRNVSSRLPPSGKTCKHVTAPITQTNLERFSSDWYAPFFCVYLGCCAAEFLNSGGTYELPCTRICVVLSVSGVHFPTNDEHLLSELSKAVRVFLQGLEQFSQDEGNEVVLSPHLSCEGRGEARWRNGDKLFRSVKLPKIMSSEYCMMWRMYVCMNRYTFRDYEQLNCYINTVNTKSFIGITRQAWEWRYPWGRQWMLTSLLTLQKYKRPTKERAAYIACLIPSA
jgi:hypothetical protein